MRLIQSPSDAQSYKRRRYKTVDSSIAIAPRVKAVTLRNLDINNLRYANIDERIDRRKLMYTKRKCVYHDDCDGHLEGSANSFVILPGLYIDNSDENLPQDTSISYSLLDRRISNADYSIQLRDHIAGKKGVLRYDCLGCTPCTSMRGVATISWHENINEVFVPNEWLTNSKFAYKQTDEASGYVNELFASRSLTDGDRGILSRAPAISDESVQPIILRGHDNPSVAVHPEMCDPLHLDFDGDEVTIVGCIESKSVAEINVEIGRAQLTKFSDNSLDTILPQDVKDQLLPGTPYRMQDFMIYSTRSVTEMSRDITMSKYDEFCGMKTDYWNKFKRDHYNKSPSPLEYLTNCRKGIIQLAESNLTVPDGFTFGRQLKHITSQVLTVNEKITSHMFDNVDKFHNHMSPTISIPRQLDPMYGYPGMRLAMKISSQYMQAALDKAKGRGVGNAAVFIIDLLQSGNPTSLVRIVDNVTGLIVTNSRVELSYIQNDMIRLKSCIASLAYGCKIARINTTNTELFTLAYLIYAMSNGDTDLMISNKSFTYLMGSLNCSIMSIASCDGLKSMDRLIFNNNVNRSQMTTISSVPSTCTMMGNVSGLLYLSNSASYNKQV
jgi:hypothetical protein